MEELHTDRFAELMKEAYLSFAKLSDIGKYFRTYCYRAVQDIDLSLNEIDVLMSLFYAPQKNTVKDISTSEKLRRDSDFFETFMGGSMSLEIMVDSGMELIEYDDSFFQEILALDSVTALYDQINEDVNGLGTILQEALAEAAAEQAE